MQSANQTQGSKTAAEVSALLRARNPLIWIVTREEARVERLLVEAAQTAQYEPRFWDCATGITKYDGSAVDVGATDPATVIEKIRDAGARQVWVLRDLHQWLRDPSVLRGVRSLARSLTTAAKDKARAVIILTPSSEIPPELAGHAIVIDWPLPDRAEIAALLDAAILALPENMRADAAPNGTREAAIDAAVGLTAEEAQSCYAKSLVSLRKIDPATVSGEKKRVIAREKVLEWYDPLPGGLDAVGGLDLAKSWLRSRRAAFSAKARAYGLPAPKGALLVGVPGCGKSLLAKAISTAWAMPLLRLDMGALQAKYVGESQQNIRKALRVAETVAPCVLWLDEIEKAMAGATQGAADGGVSVDALGAVLTWMQERQAPVFMVATANKAEDLPPELIRRFDAMFFVDLPNKAERAEVIRAALKANGRDADKLADFANIPALVNSTEEFTGAELAGIVPDAMFTAFADGERELEVRDLLESAGRTVPLAKTAAEKIKALRSWAQGRARNASTPTAGAALDNTRKLDV